ncbi:MAG: DUF4278 domain-containing protein [Microcoleaceae cyanobacterium]
MDFTYRGIGYRTQFSPVDFVEGELGGKYRGQEWNIHYPRHIPVPQPYSTLKYRGINYKTSALSNNVVALNLPTTQLPGSAKSISAGLVKAGVVEAQDDFAQVHRANVCRLLEHRQQVAQAKGDQKLLKALEREAQQLVC